jgi:hypothetical protein
MIDLQEIRETIDEIKRHGTTIGQAEKLALLYIAAEHMEREEEKNRPRREDARGYAQDAAAQNVVSVEHKSDFLAACDGVPVADVLAVIDEHMEAIRVLYPKEHAVIIRRIEEKRR